MADRSTIGHAAAAAQCKVQTIRYYEQIGLLPVPPRSAGNQRLYGPADIRRLGFIRHARALGFSLPAIRDLLTLANRPEQSCGAVDSIARAQLQDVERRLVRLNALCRELERMIQQCQGGRIADCRVIETLGDHDLCEAADHQSNDVTEESRGRRSRERFTKFAATSRGDRRPSALRNPRISKRALP